MNPFLFLLLLTSLLFSSSVLAASVHCRSDMYEVRQLQVTNEGWELQSNHGVIKVYNRKGYCQVKSCLADFLPEPES